MSGLRVEAINAVSALELEEGMVFALETYCAASDGHSRPASSTRSS
jgi:hypothetical protein